jgi:hypothetical protein
MKGNPTMPSLQPSDSRSERSDRGTTPPHTLVRLLAAIGVVLLAVLVYKQLWPTATAKLAQQVLGVQPAPEPEQRTPVTSDKVKLANLKRDLRNLMTAQEAYFGDHKTYAPDLQTLLAAGTVALYYPGSAQVLGVPTGFEAAVEDRSVTVGFNMCYVRVGAGVPPNIGGVIICNEPAPYRFSLSREVAATGSMQLASTTPEPLPRPSYQRDLTSAGLTLLRRSPSQLCEAEPEGALVIRVEDGGVTTFVGDQYQVHSRATNSELSFGGWTDHYFDFLRFDLRSVKPAWAREGVSIVLCLFVTDLPPNDPGLILTSVSESWDAASLTIQTRPAEKAVGGFGAVAKGWNAVNVEDVVRAWIRGVLPNEGVSLRPLYNDHTNGSFAGAHFEDASKRPRLVFVPPGD